MPEHPKMNAEEILTAVLDAVGALVVVLDRQGRIVHWNRACEETTGYTFAEMKGTYVWDRLLVAEEIEGVRAVFRRLQAGLFPNTHENYWVTRDGSRRMISWSNTAILGSEGVVEFIIGTGINITRERELDRKVRVSEHLASFATMAAGITHEINNPLNAAHLQLTILQRRLKRLDGSDAATALEAAQGVSTEIQRVSALAQEFLEFSRPPPIERSRVELLAVVEDVVWLCRPEADSARVALDLGEKSSIQAEVDHERIKQVVLNLTRNAIEAVGPGGHVRLSVCGREGDALILVEDDGPGLPASYEEIVEPFFTTKKHGTGLGLAVTHRIVADHDGSIAVDRRAGRTIFTVTLPAAPSAPLRDRPRRSDQLVR